MTRGADHAVQVLRFLQRRASSGEIPARESMPVFLNRPSDSSDDANQDSSSDAVPPTVPSTGSGQASTYESDIEMAIAESLNDQRRAMDEEEQFRLLLEQTRREEEERERIRKFVSNRECMREFLVTLKGVDPDDPIFEQFYE